MALQPFDGELDAPETSTQLQPFDGEIDGAEKPKSSVVRRVVGDTGVSLLKGAISVPEAAVGIADIATGGRAGKVAEEGFGFKPKQAKEIISDLYSPEQKLANQKVAEAEGFVDTVKTAFDNPSTIAQTVVESLPLIGAGGVAGVGARAAGVSKPFIAGAVGEGAVGAGMAAEGIRQEADDGLLTGKQALSAAGSGFGTAALGALGGKLAQKAGIADVDTLAAGGEALSRKGLLRRVVEGGISEGVFEELPQSVQEQMWQNYALDKPLLEGVDNAAAMGLLAGSTMGGVAAGFGTRRPDQITEPTSAPVDEFEAEVAAQEAEIRQRKEAAGIIKPTNEGDANVSEPIATTELASSTATNELDNQQGSVPVDVLQRGSEPVYGELDSAGQLERGNEQDTAAGTTSGTQNTAITAVDAAAQEAATSPVNELPEPTQAQKEAGNYKLGHTKVSGLDVSVENPDGSTRSGRDKDGNEWSRPMNGHYGYVKGVKARAPDKEHVDVNVKAGTADTFEGDVFIVNQIDPATGKFDEPKAYIGYGSRDEAEAAYRSNYDENWQGMGDIAQVPIAKFKEMLNDERAFLKPVRNSESGIKNPDLYTSIDSDVNKTENSIPDNRQGNEQDLGEIRPIVESITKRRAAAAQINREKPFDRVLAAAKKMMAGESVKVGQLQLDVKTLKGDAELFDAATKLVEIAKAPAKTAKADQAQSADSYAERISNATSRQELEAVINDITKDASLTDRQVEQLDDAVMDAMDAIEEGRPVAPKKAVISKAERMRKRMSESRKVDTARDNMLTAMAKVGGFKIGMPNQSDIKASLGIESNKNQQVTFPGGFAWLFTKNGKTISQMAERMHELGYIDAPEESALEESLAEYRGENHSYAYSPEYAETMEALVGEVTQAEFEAADTWTLADAWAKYAAIQLVQDVDWDNFISGIAVDDNVLVSISKQAQDYHDQFLSDLGDYYAQLEQENAGNAGQSDAAAARKRDEDSGRGGAESRQESTASKSQTQSPGKVTDLLGQDTQSAQALKDAERAKDAKRNSGVDDADDFTLTGSTRPADEANARGARDLFDEKPQSTDVKTPEQAQSVDATTELEKAKEALREAGVKGKDFTDTIKDVRQGNLTAEEVAEAHSAKIEDFGEKMAGAKKDMEAASRKEWSDEDLVSQPLSKVWPVGDINAIEDPYMAAWSFAARAEIPAKPRKSYKVSRWVESVKSLRAINKMALDGIITKELIKERLNSFPGLAKFEAKVRLLEQLPRDQWKRIGNVAEWPNAYTYDADGNKIPKPQINVDIDGRHKSFPVASVEEAISDVNEFIGVAAPEKKMEFQVRGREGNWHVYKAGDSAYHKLSESFSDSKDAFAFIKNNYADLVSAWDAVKERENVKKTDVRSKDNKPRTGQNWRNGKDATPEQFAKQFGFRGIEWGNWVNQGKGAKERQGMLNQAYDALMDLADIVGIPPKAISLNGTLGLAFGSRGHGWASAHYEPGNLVINLTKTRGAGNLAHEWFHGLDNYFQRMRPDFSLAGRHLGYITYAPENYYAYKDGKTRLPEADYKLMAAGEKGRRGQRFVGKFNPDDWTLIEGVRPVVAEAFADLVKVLNESPMNGRARAIDGPASDGYWSRIIERAARSFENYVIHKMRLNGYDNDYLANVVSPEDFPRDAERYPYLIEGEIQPVADAFDNLFGTIETKETDTGVAMFSRSGRSKTYPQLSNVLEQYEGTGEILTVSDLVDEVEALIDADEAPESLQYAINEYREELAFDNTLSGRGDMDAAEERFIEQVIAAVGGDSSFIRSGTSGRTPFVAQQDEGYIKTLNNVIALFKSGDRAKQQEAGKTPVPISRTPVVLRQVMEDDGSKPFKRADFVVGQGSTLYLKADNVHSRSIHTGRISKDVLDRLPQLLADPIAVFKSSPASEDAKSFKVLLDAVDENGDPVIVAIKPNVPMQQLGNALVNFQATIFPVKWDKVREWNKEGFLRYYNEKSPLVSRPANNPLGTASENSEDTQEGFGTNQTSVAASNPREAGENSPARDWFDANIGVAASKVKVVSRGDIEWMNPVGYSRQFTGSGMAVADVERAVNRIRAGWKNAPEIIVVDNMSDSRIRKAVRDENDRQLSQGAEGQPEGFYDAGKVYIVASELNGEADIVRVLFHETLGHGGLRGLYGAGLGKILDEVALLRNKDILDKAKQYGLDATNKADRRIAAEEVLAEMAQTNPQIGFVKRAIAAIRNWLRANMPYFKDLELTDADIIQGYLMPARRYVEGVQVQRAGGSLMPAFIRNDDQDLFDAMLPNWGVKQEYQGETGVYNGARAIKNKFVALVMPEVVDHIHGLQGGGDRIVEFEIRETKHGDRIGSATIEMRGNKPVALHDIAIDRAYRGNGYAKQVVGALLSAAPGRSMEIIEILDSAEGFWRKSGVHTIGYTDGNATLTWRDFAEANPEARGGKENKHGSFSRSASRGDAEASAYETADAGSEYVRQRPAVDQTQTPQFRNWFGDSVVTDNGKPMSEGGKPLVVYRGGSKGRTEFKIGDGGTYGPGIYMTFDKDDAEGYASGRADGGQVYSLYARIENAATPEIAAKFEEKYQSRAAKEMQKAGYDGVIDPGVELVVFDSTQIKSATQNQGTFDPANPDIRFSRSGVAQQGLTPSWNAPEPSKMDNLIYALQDKNVDLRRVTQAIKKAGADIADRWNAYLQEELYHGRTAKRTKDFIKDELDPLIEDMRMRGVKMADFEEYLWARHAEERNKQIAKINPDMPDGGSGLTTAEAREYLAGLDDGTKKRYESLAKRVDAINKQTQQTLVDYGIESVDTIAAWNGAYKNYVPLMREDMDTGFGNGTGQGYSIKGNSAKRATGSKRAVVDIIANIAQQREKALIRGEKNRVATALIGLAELNPNKEFWKTDTIPMIKQVGRDGLVEERQDPNYKNRDNVVVARITNSEGKIEEHSVIFNEFDERAMRMAASIKNLDQDQIGELLGTAAVITRYFASINTQYNPIFGIINIVRDVQGAALNLSSTALAGKQKQVLGLTLPAMKGIYQEVRARRDGKKVSGQWSELWEEFQKEGGQTGYRDMFRNSRERADKLEHALDPEWWQKKGWGKAISANGTLAAPQQWLVSGPGKALFDWLSDYNDTLENSVRLAAYKVGKEQGMSKQQAASLAKNLTVNFNRKGEMGRQIGSLYAFFNASIQGTARIAETIFKDGKLSTAGKSIVYGGMLLGAMQALALAAAGFDEDEPPEFLRDRNLIMPIGNGKYLSFPMPLGFNAIPATGRIITEWAMAGFKEPEVRFAHLLEVYMDMFNPIGYSGLSMQTLAPTMLDPLAALTENKDWTGMPIARNDFNNLNPTPGHTRAKDTASTLSKGISYGINAITGGTEFKPGALSPTPDQIDYLFGQLTGGVGREAMKAEQTATSIVTGEELPSYKIPLAGRFFGDASGQASQGAAFYNNLRELNKHENQIKGMRKNGEDVTEYRKENPESFLINQAAYAEKSVRTLRNYKRTLLSKNASPSEIQRVETRITEIMKRLNDNVRLRKET